MTQATQRRARSWTTQRAIVIAAVCLMVGIVAGYFLRGTHIGSVPAPAAVTGPAVAAPAPAANSRAQADAQAKPIIEKIKVEPRNSQLLIEAGNIYYDAQQYPIALDFYGRALAIDPSNVAVRTDMGTAYWFLGNADAAITEFTRALSYDPASANTLFNRGLVAWQGKKDAAMALGDWNKLLTVEPNYPQKEKVQELIAEVHQSTGK